MPFIASKRLAKIELGFGRNSCVVLHWFFVSQVAERVLDLASQLSVVPTSYTGNRPATGSTFGLSFFLSLMGEFGVGKL
jgi:hypothetical protein